MITKTEEENGASKDLEDSFLPLHVVAGPSGRLHKEKLGACTKKIELSSLNYLLGILHRRTRRVRARNKEGRGTTLNLPNKKFGSNQTRNSAQF